MTKYLFSLLLLCGIEASARVWTSAKDGKQVDAEIVEVYRNRTVKLRTNNKVITVPFTQFIAADIAYLERWKKPSKPTSTHRISWEELNQALGTDLFQDTCLWDDPTEQVGDRLNLTAESKTKFMENYRAYPEGKRSLFEEALYAVALYGDDASTTELSFIFINQADAKVRYAHHAAKQIEATADALESRVTALLGKPRRDSLGSRKMYEKVSRWDWHEHAFMLSVKEASYVILRVMPTKRADRAGRVEKMGYDQLRNRLADCVHRRQNSDVIIQEIPMIDQGPKGYCVPATCERYLRYFGIPADMYLMGVLAESSGSRGTTLSGMTTMIKPILASNSRDLIELNEALSLKTISEYIDRGLPLMWVFQSSEPFQDAVNQHTQNRENSHTLPLNMKQKIREAQNRGGHINLIIGYNAETREVCISDSWGASYAERWVPLHLMQLIEQGALMALKW